MVQCSVMGDSFGRVRAIRSCIPLSSNLWISAYTQPLNIDVLAHVVGAVAELCKPRHHVRCRGVLLKMAVA